MSGEREQRRVRVAASAARCPYCHDDCAPAEAVVCRDCLARHHAACWDEGGACATCSGAERLVPAAAGEGLDRTWGQVAFALQGVGLLGCAALVTQTQAEGPTYAGGFLLLGVTALLLPFALAGRVSARALGLQIALTLATWTLGPLMIVAGDISGTQPSYILGLLGLSLATISLGWSRPRVGAGGGPARPTPDPTPDPKSDLERPGPPGE